ncbi:MAG: type IV pilin N-terminal domain-containing protein [Candidatus Poseidoniaceae archaeon]|jgi:FlaG/FlaF family flagellin (archaellin)|nr:type IV pilin N-terminal domain-containing protein [Candidatus Poseidoniaceae archaeon]
MQSDDDAVSPVIATVLLLAITVLLSSMVFVMMSSTLGDVEKQAPTASVSVRSLSNGYDVITFSYLDQQLDPGKVEWKIIDRSEGVELVGSGNVNDPDVYGTVGANVSFHDRDAGWAVSTGDYFVINCETLGCDDGNHYFQIIDLEHQTTLVDVRIPVDN